MTIRTISNIKCYRSYKIREEKKRYPNGASRWILFFPQRAMVLLKKSGHQRKGKTKLKKISWNRSKHTRRVLKWSKEKKTKNSIINELMIVTGRRSIKKTYRELCCKRWKKKRNPPSRDKDYTPFGSDNCITYLVRLTPHSTTSYLPLVWKSTFNL